ncbi:histidine phosphatase family protein [Rhizobium sp. NXC24]|uniref:histidine phosphatase family protein n=1 Tax=Rhizobium sp. NXC24 TaxID=2048897 RepID=UPI000CDF352F|nr:histidine phosphatase family protein [Rhizobium sp. NXC24]AVA25612.1 phosphoglycerate mutase family protein [Rhizobium sp. NXC24]
MTATFFLVRHAAHDDVGSFLAGRMGGVVLGAAGQAQADRLGQRMKRENVEAIYTSPRERARQTAAAIAAACNLAPPQISDALDEVNFGEWTGKTFDILNGDPQWRRWNSLRSLSRTPGGESMLDVQQRVFGLIETLANNGKRLTLVSHGDVLKAAVCHILGLPIDAWPKFDIAPASITTMAVGDWGAKIITLNEMSP